VEEGFDLMEPGYNYDVYISYRHSPSWDQYVTKHFLPIFKFWLAGTLASEPRVFSIGDIESADTWPQRLAALQRRSNWNV
jgi:hypothetical protein